MIKEKNLNITKTFKSNMENHLDNSIRFCACGCGQERDKYDKWGRERKYISGHNPVWFKEKRKNLQIMNEIRYCVCGCNQKIIIKLYHRFYGISKYVLGHNHKNKTYEEIYGEEKAKEIKNNIERNQKISLGNKGKHHSEETKKKLKGRIPWNKGLKGIMKAWNKGLTKENSEGVKRISEKRKSQIMPFKDTLPELLIQNKLKELNIAFRTHEPILGQPDIFIEPNICIFVDGCYWHSCTQCFDRNKFNERQNLQIMKDIIIKQKLVEDNYIVLRLWEHDIKENINGCTNQIKERLCYIQRIEKC